MTVSGARNGACARRVLRNHLLLSGSEAEAAEEIKEARVRAERVVDGIHLQEDHPVGTFFETFF